VQIEIVEGQHRIPDGKGRGNGAVGKPECKKSSLPVMIIL